MDTNREDILTDQVNQLVNQMEEVRKDIKLMIEQHNELKLNVALKFRTAETVLKTIKYLVLAGFAVLTFKFGDLSKIWHDIS